MNLKNPINKFKSMLEAEQKVKSLEAELNIRNKTCEERGLVIDKLKEGLNTKPALDRKIATNLQVNKEFKEYILTLKDYEVNIYDDIGDGIAVLKRKY